MNNEESQPVRAKKERDCWYDNAKALMLVCVVVGHLLLGKFSDNSIMADRLGTFIYVFHMPVLMIITGKFAKHRIDNCNYKKVVYTNVVPYLIAQAAMVLLYSVINKNFTDGILSVFNPLFGLWYIAVIAIYALVTPALKKHKSLFWVSLVLMFGTMFLPHTLFGCFNRAVQFYPFYLFGYYISDVNIDFCKRWWFRIISGVATLGLLLVCMRTNLSDKLDNDVLYMDSVFKDLFKGDVTQGICWYVPRVLLGFMFFFFIMGICPSKKTFFSYIGQFSLYVYILHLYVIIIIRYMEDKYSIYSYFDTSWKKSGYIMFGVVLAFVLASKPVRKVFKHFLQPDVPKMIASFKGEKD